jgi:hypothetical protein
VDGGHGHVIVHERELAPAGDGHLHHRE